MVEVLPGDELSLTILKRAVADLLRRGASSDEALDHLARAQPALFLGVGLEGIDATAVPRTAEGS